MKCDYRANAIQRASAQISVSNLRNRYRIGMLWKSWGRASLTVLWLLFAAPTFAQVSGSIDDDCSSGGYDLGILTPFMAIPADTSGFENDFGFDGTCPGGCGGAEYYGGMGADGVATFQVSVSGSWTFQTCPNAGNYDSSLMLRTGGPCPGTTCVRKDDDSCDTCAGPNYKASISENLTAGNTYYLIVDGWGNGAVTDLLVTGPCSTNEDCGVGDNDGIFCNGVPSCINGVCSPGTNPCSGTTPACDEATDSCLSCAADPSVCLDDGLFCNGPGVCLGSGACAQAGDPCSALQVCNESNNSCPALNSTFALVPVGANAQHIISGNEIRLFVGGAEVELEARIANWDPDCPGACNGSPTLSGYQFLIDAAGYSGANATPPNPGIDLVPKGYPSTPEEGVWITTLQCATSGRDCSLGQPACAGPEGACVPNPRFVLGCCAANTMIDSSTTAYAVGASATSGAAVDNGQAKYAATLVIEVPVGAAGTYTLSFDPNSNETFWLDSSSALSPPINLVTATIRIESCVNDAECEDGLFCNGPPVCLPSGACSQGGNPCNSAETCVETIDICRLSALSDNCLAGGDDLGTLLPFMIVPTNTTGFADDFSCDPNCPAPCGGGCEYYGTNGADGIIVFTVPTNGIWKFGTCTSPFDTSLALREGGSCPGNNCVAQDDDSCDGCNQPYAAQISANLMAGNTYYLIVDGWGGGFASDLTIGGPCTTNEDCNFDSGFYCSAVTCVGGICTAGVNPCSGTTPACDEATDSCLSCAADPSVCLDDGLFCNGPGVCLGSGACAQAGDPCSALQVCNESNNSCPALNSTFALVPVGANAQHIISGNEIRLFVGGAEVELEARIANWDPDCPGACNGSPTLSGYQFLMDAAGYLGANAAPPNPGIDLVPKGFPSTPDEGVWITALQCATSGRNCSLGQPACVGPEGACVPNPRFVLGCCDANTMIDTSTIAYAVGASATSGAAVDNGQAKYAATIVIDVPVGAAGTYTLSFDPNSNETFWLDSSSAQSPPINLVTATIRIEPCVDDAECEDGLFCNGPPVCLPSGACSQGGNPCPPPQVCFETADSCQAIDDDCSTGGYDLGILTPYMAVPADTTGLANDFGCDPACGANPCDFAGICSVYNGQAADGVATFQVPTTGVWTFSSCANGVAFDSSLSIREGGVCPGVNCVAQDGDGCAGCAPPYKSVVSANLTTGNTYYLIVDGYSGSGAVTNLLVTGPCTTNEDCGDDGVFCNGIPSCANGTCTAGTSPCSGTTPVCEEATDSCLSCAASPSICVDDGLFCNGPGICLGSGACGQLGNPCSPSQGCDETADVCSSTFVALTPVGANAPYVITGNEIRLYAGGVEIEFKIQVDGWDPDCELSCDGSPLLAAYQVHMDSATYLGANATPPNPGVNLQPKGFPATPGDGAWITTDVCSASGRDCSPGETACAGAEGFCIPNSDFVLGCCSPFQAIDLTSIEYVIGAVTGSGAAADDGQAKYAGSLVLELPPSASGTYQVSFLADPDQTFLLDSNAIPIPMGLLSALVRIEPCLDEAGCTDGLFCNGAETCQAGSCVPGQNPCSGSAPLCDEPTAICTCAGASSSFEDCNANGIHDDCDIVAGTSEDCNVNSVADECETGCVTASAQDVGPGQSSQLTPGGGTGDPTQDPLVNFTNQSSGTADVSVNATTDPVQAPSSGFQTFGTTLLLDTTLVDGEFMISLFIPFNASDLGGSDPLSIDLSWYDPNTTAWVVAAAGNTVNSPGHSGPIGDRFALADTITPPVNSLSSDLGDYGVFWNSSTQEGFAWVNIDHASAFAAGIQVLLPPLNLSNDVPKNRYVSFVPNNGSGPVAFRVNKLSSPTGTCWVQAPISSGTPSVFTAKCGSSPTFRLWQEPAIHVGDCEIMPVAQYEIRATIDSGVLSPPITVSTIAEPVLNLKKWGDVAGVNNGTLWTPPNQLTNVNDVLAVLSYITDAAVKPTFPQANLQAISSVDPCLNAFVNTAEILILVKAIAGDAYPFVTNPANCPVCP